MIQNCNTWSSNEMHLNFKWNIDLPFCILSLAHCPVIIEASSRKHTIYHDTDTICYMYPTWMSGIFNRMFEFFPRYFENQNHNSPIKWPQMSGVGSLRPLYVAAFTLYTHLTKRDFFGCWFDHLNAKTILFFTPQHLHNKF